MSSDKQSALVAKRKKSDKWKYRVQTLAIASNKMPKLSYISLTTV